MPPVPDIPHRCQCLFGIPQLRQSRDQPDQCLSPMLLIFNLARRGECLSEQRLWQVAGQRGEYLRPVSLIVDRPCSYKCCAQERSRQVGDQQGQC